MTAFIVGLVIGIAAGSLPLIIWYHDVVAKLRRDQFAAKQTYERAKAQSTQLATEKTQFQRNVTAFESHRIKYDGLAKENSSLKQTLFNLSVQVRKTERDHEHMLQRQETINTKATELATRFMRDNIGWITGKLNTNNFATCKERLAKVIKWSRGIGFHVSKEDEAQFMQELKTNFESVVRDDFRKQEQARIKAQIREEEKLNREIDKQLSEARREQEIIQKALDKALKETEDEHSAEIEALRAKHKEAVEKFERAKSQAQLTKTGHVYVISNIGSLGEDVYKIGMTRRLEPLDRVKELGDASVPFPFDIHMMISSDDAPSLENSLHRQLHEQRVNKVNYRKEFFRIDFEHLCKIVEANHGEIEYVETPEALEYRESLNLTDDDREFVDDLMQSLIEETDSEPGGD